VDEMQIEDVPKYYTPIGKKGFVVKVFPIGHQYEGCV